MDDNDEVFGECDPIGEPVFIDLDGKKYYWSIVVHNKTVSVGNCVRVVLEQQDDDDGIEKNFGFCQILAIFDDPDPNKGVYTEARWFLEPEDVANEIGERKKMKLELHPNELVESDILDDIPAGSIAEIIHIKDGKQPRSMTSSKLNFTCRFMKTSDSQSCQQVSVESMLTRGMAFSDYRHCYFDHLSADGGAKGIKSSEADVHTKAIRQLHVSVLPESLPCRAEERAAVEQYLRGGIVSGDSINPIYISGMPGTGKTATIMATIRALKKEAAEGKIPEFDFVEINCLRLQTPADAYTALWRAMSGEHAHSNSAKKHLTAHFASLAAAPPGGGKKGGRVPPVTVCLMDEIDFLMTRDENVIYSFFDWPLTRQSRLIVVGVSNVMDLPERLSTSRSLSRLGLVLPHLSLSDASLANALRVKSRLALNLVRMVFKVYSHKQIKEIITQRLQELGAIFDSNAAELLARKASTVAGDLRAALKMCQRAIEIFRERRSKGGTGTESRNQGAHGKQLISTELVKLACDEYKEEPFRATIKRLPALDKALLVCVCKHVAVSGEREVSMEMLWGRLTDLVAAHRREWATKETIAQELTATASSSLSSSITTKLEAAVNGIPKESGAGVAGAMSAPPQSPRPFKRPLQLISQSRVLEVGVSNDVNSTKNEDEEEEVQDEGVEKACGDDDDGDEGQELLHECEYLSLLMPHYAAFEEAVERLTTQGLLRRTCPRGLEALPRLSLLSLRPEAGDVYGALRDQDRRHDHGWAKFL